MNYKEIIKKSTSPKNPISIKEPKRSPLHPSMVEVNRNPNPSSISSIILRNNTLNSIKNRNLGLGSSQRDVMNRENFNISPYRTHRRVGNTMQMLLSSPKTKHRFL